MSQPTLVLRNGTVLFHEKDDHVTPLRNTDVLVSGDTIIQIGKSLETTFGQDVKVIDCTGKIVSPGFIDTHHHLWQTQLKGRIADETLFDYFPIANMQSGSYMAEDMYWGQLGGCLEAIDAGTTMVVDHSHGTFTKEHASNALAATAASGLRAIYCYNYILRIQQWDKTKCVPADELMPDWATKQIEDFAAKQPFGDSRVHFGFGFDLFFLPREVVIGIFEKVRKAGAKLITIHVAKNGVFGMTSFPNLLRDYGLLAPDILISHGGGLDTAEKKLLSDSGVYISSTPTTEAQMGMGWPVAFEGGVKACLGVDCHASDSTFLPEQMKLALQLARLRTNLPIIADGKFPKNLRGSVEGAFNLGTIEGARACGMEADIGSISVGKKADLLVWDAASPGMVCASAHDPVVAVVRHSSPADIETVVIGGKIVKEGGRLVDVDVLGGDREIEVADGVLATAGKRGKVSWAQVARELVRSREEIQTRIDGQDVEKGKELLAAMWHIDTAGFVDVD